MFGLSASIIRVCHRDTDCNNDCNIAESCSNAFAKAERIGSVEVGGRGSVGGGGGGGSDGGGGGGVVGGGGSVGEGVVGGGGTLPQSGSAGAPEQQSPPAGVQVIPPGGGLVGGGVLLGHGAI